ncbi:MAG: CoA transferase [Rhodospirillaceae bacterium]|jgi:crotonobetainyl-CoA:carnitine CoA-transferase CaiB-like acyl-CoA transferase|nr:CoA transferase [Rhodospirillaceae bacterium]MBT3493489.1 CoA transferase [Rhodospirillaceae bacterium]MBT3779003.1 CoA transferase [Rhodospirillaceae bacterium]MBT3976828.1 CoA transferase [Rhodospirillaceae bacterium]MBT4565347.1 CoA transferase [Rhodospirillaceae bacterium]
MKDALKGISILEVGVMTPGQYCGFLMTGWGATSIRIERDHAANGISNEDLLLNRGKQSVVLNLRDPDDHAAFLELARTADVLIESYRPGVSTRLGIDYDAIRAINPGIIYCSQSGFGQNGPEAGRAAYDMLFQAETGLLHALNANASEITAPQTYIADAANGLMAAFAISAALQGRNQTGEGRHIDLSMQETAFSLLSVSHGTMRDGQPVSGNDAADRSLRPANNIYRTRDDRHIVITAISEKSCRALFRHLGDEEQWQLGLETGNPKNQAKAFLQERFAGNDAQHWVDVLTPLGIEIGMVKTPEEAFDSPQLAARNMVLDTHDHAGNALRQIGFPATPKATPHLEPAPEPGANQQELTTRTSK